MGRRLERRRTTLHFFRRLALSTLVLGLLCGCDSEQQRIGALVRQASADRAGAADALAEARRADRISFGAAFDHAFDLLEQSQPAALSYAGAVLDGAVILDDELPQSGEYEIFWLRMGRLAYLSAGQAYDSGELELARSLVLAGPKRWQRDSYWQRYPDHDALAALILAQTGERDEALRRLESRAILNPPADEVYRTLRGR